MPPKEDFSIRETKPNIGGEINSTSHKLSLVEVQHFLYVRVAEANNLPLNPATGSCDPYVELRIGNYRAATRTLQNNLNPKWNQVFSFRKDRLQGKTLEISVKDRSAMEGEIGTLSIAIGDVPTSLPWDGPLAPQEYRLLKKDGHHGYEELMLALWIGNQTDDEYPNACPLDAATVSGDKIEYMRPKTYQQPRLWYLRVKLIDAQDLVPPLDPNQKLEVYVKAKLGDVVLRTKVSSNKSVNPSWNEELMFVASEPFEDRLVLSLEDDSRDDMKLVLGIYEIPLHKIDRRLVAGAQSDKWVDLKPRILSGEVKQANFASKLHLNLYLDGVYHVFDEPAQFSSDLTATSPKMKPGAIGTLELGIVKADGLAPMKIKNGLETTDAYCVARYGYKWIRTSTIVGSLAPKWNEQYKWDVYDLCTVITVGVFDNCNLQAGPGGRDSSIGKVRIRLSTLVSGRIYTLAYPLVGFRPDGLKKMGELHLNVRFSCSSIHNLLKSYAQPLLPKLQYTQPLSVYQQNTFRHNAVHLICLRFSRYSPPLRKEVVEYMLGAKPRVWSVRRARANLQRVMEFLSYFSAAWKWFDDIRQWKDSAMTVSVWLLFILLVIYPELIPPMVFCYLAYASIMNFGKRPKHPPFLDMKLSQADNTTVEDWQEEFDTFPSSVHGEILRNRYDRLRGIGEMIVTTVGELAHQLERVQCVTSWRDPRATPIFVVFCVFAALLTYFLPFKLFLLLLGTFLIRPPMFRVTLPPIPQNFLRRMPSKEDYML